MNYYFSILCILISNMTNINRNNPHEQKEDLGILNNFKETKIHTLTLCCILFLFILLNISQLHLIWFLWYCEVLGATWGFKPISSNSGIEDSKMRKLSLTM